jgi:Holliday junction resolvasome RuvABC endonuclease subunit
MNLGLINEKPKRICSIDASTNSLAFAIFDDHKLTMFGKINFNGTDIYYKVGDAARKTGAVLEQFSFDAIAIEHTVYINSPKTMSELSMVQGALLGSAMSRGVSRVKSINPITWQTFIGNGKLSQQDRKEIVDANPGKSAAWYKKQERDLRKQKTIKFVNTYYDVNITDNDVADAVGIGHYAIRNWSKMGS